MKNNIYLFVSVFVALMIILSASMVANAAPSEASLDDSVIVYPIAELGNCKDKADCAKFCSLSSNMLACVDFAEKNGILKGENLRISKAVAEKISKGETPGGCTDQTSCENFCKGKVENINQCIAFAEELSILPPEELAQAKNVAKALVEGATLPGQCKSKEECENYCSNGTHIDECLAFAEKASILSPEELKEARAVAPFLKNGETPGKCQNKDECENYCSDSSHFDECIGFAEKAGFISKDEAEMAKKVGGSGPGGCKNSDECEAYCNEENHANECASFALEKGLVDEKTADLMKNGIDEMKKALESLPPPVRSDVEGCLKMKIGSESYQKIINKEVSPTKKQGESIESCFSNIEEKVKTYMMQQAGGSTQGGLGVPSADDIEDMIPDNVPPDIQQDIINQVNSAQTSVPPSTSGGVMAAPSSGQIPQVDCASFSSVPSCSYVPDSVRDQCERCKAQ